MKSTRDRILQTLLEHPQSTVIDLANAVNINGISVRHHLSSLLADGLVVAEEVRHGVGRPKQVFSLTETGLERFPTRYLRLTNRLLDQLKRSLPEEALQQIFNDIASRITSTYAQKGYALTMEQKLDILKEFLMEEGFSIDWKKNGDEYILNEITCPYFQVGQSHPELCALDKAIISQILSTPVEKQDCVLHGDAQCTYVIRKTS